MDCAAATTREILPSAGKDVRVHDGAARMNKTTLKAFGGLNAC